MQLDLLDLMPLAGEESAPLLNPLPMNPATLAISAQRICTNLVDPSAIGPLLACRLIALNKNPGVRPIGIGDNARRIIAKAILTVTKPDIQEAAGSIQLCAGQISGIEAAVHAADSLFQQDDTEAILLVDASNAFNSLNRLSALHNIRHLCPSLATPLSTHTGHLLNYLLMVTSFTQVKEQLKGTLLLCPCMHLPQYH